MLDLWCFMRDLLDKLKDILEDIKAQNIVTIDVKNITTFADYLVICTGRSKRHVYSIADNVKENTKKLLAKKPNSQGLEACEWVIVDLGSIIVHIMLPEIRDFYQLEKLWDKDLIMTANTK